MSTSITRLLRTTTLLVIVAHFAPRLAVADEKPASDLSPELALISQDAFTLLHLRPADLWASEPVGKLRNQFAKEVEILLVLAAEAAGRDVSERNPPREVELASVSFVDIGLVASPFAPVLETVLIVTTTKPFDRKKAFGNFLGDLWVENRHKGKIFFTADGAGLPITHGRGVYPINDRTYVFALPARLRKLIDRPQQPGGPLADAVALASKKHQVVLGLNLTAPPALEWKKRFAREHPFEWWSNVRALRPLIDVRSAALALDLGRRSRAEGRLTFADETRAAKAFPAVQDALVLFRIHQLGSLHNDLGSTFDENIEAPQKLRETALGLGLLEEAEAGLRAAKVERRGAHVLVAAQADTDIDALQDRARQQVKALLADETTQRRRGSVNRLKQLAIAFHEHAGKFHGRLPPAAICSKKDGKPLLSWRVAILPFVNEAALYGEFKLDELWDSPHNIKLLPRMPKIFAVPGIKTKEAGTTYYQAFVGPEAALDTEPDRTSPYGAWGTAIPKSFRDGTSNTIGLVEASEPVPWTKPVDLVYGREKPLPKLGGVFPNGFHAAFMDGSVSFLSADIDAQTLRALITRAGGEVVDWFKYRLR